MERAATFSASSSMPALLAEPEVHYATMGAEYPMVAAVPEEEAADTETSDRDTIAYLQSQIVDCKDENERAYRRFDSLRMMTVLISLFLTLMIACLFVMSGVALGHASQNEAKLHEHSHEMRALHSQIEALWDYDVQLCMEKYSDTLLAQYGVDVDSINSTAIYYTDDLGEGGLQDILIKHGISEYCSMTIAEYF